MAYLFFKKNNSIPYQSLKSIENLEVLKALNKSEINK